MLRARISVSQALFSARGKFLPQEAAWTPRGHLTRRKMSESAPGDSPERDAARGRAGTEMDLIGVIFGDDRGYVDTSRCVIVARVRRRSRESELRLEQLIHRLRVRLATGRTHHLADEPSDHRGLRSRLFRLVGILGDDLVDDLLDCANISDLPEAALLDERARISTLAPKNLEQVLGNLTGNRSFGDQVEDRAELLRRHRRGGDLLALP